LDAANRSSWPGKSAKRVFAQMSRPSTSCGTTEKKDVDARDKRGHDDCAWMSTPFQLRPYRDDDEDAAIALWQQTWQQAYPAIDFAARVPWWRERWRGELVPNAAIIVAERAGALIGFVTIDLKGYLDQLVVGPDHWGSALGNALVDEAKRLSPDHISLLVNTDNARAIRFYERNGFVQAGGDVNPTSGRPVLRMEWKG
jgi:putative acetyltransferase